MKASTKIIIAAAAAVVLVGGTSVAVIASSHSAVPKTAGASHSATATLPPSATPTPSPTPSKVADTGAMDGEDLEGPAMPIITNVRDFRNVAEAATLAYMTLNPDESVAARAARLAPYFPAGSKFLTEPPLMKNPQGYVAIRTTVTATGKPSSDSYPATTTDSSYTFGVYMGYNAEYDASGDKKVIPVTSGKWTVTMNKKFDGKIQSIQEPYL